jgi:hypothetical protein
MKTSAWKELCILRDQYLTDAVTLTLQEFDLVRAVVDAATSYDTEIRVGDWITYESYAALRDALEALHEGER